MMREIETIREALTGLRSQVETMTCLALEIPALKALATLEAEIEPLRECALDLSGVPDGWGWILHTIPDGNIRATLANLGGSGAEAIGLTPRAAFDAAIGRIGG